MNNPLISIILPVYNGENFLAESISSCLNQTYTNIELIIVDDCSTDNSLDIAEHFKRKDSRVKIIKNGLNKKLPSSLNIGHKQASGDFITWTSDDNIFHENALEKMFLKLDQEKADLVYCDYLILNQESEIIGQSRLKPLEYLLFYGVIGACFLYRKEVYYKNNGYREDLFLVEDYDFWLRAIKHSVFVRIDIPVYYYYRYHSNSLTERMKKEPLLKKMFLENLRILYFDFFDHPLIKNKSCFVEFFIKRFENGPTNNLQQITDPTFFQNLEFSVKPLNGVSYYKLKRIVLEDSIETILHNQKYQNLKILYRLHITGRKYLLQLPIERYLALIKKTII